MAPTYYSIRTCVVFLLAIVFAWYAIPTLAWDSDEALLNSLLFATFHLLALLSSKVADDAERERDRVQALNRPLASAQRLQVRDRTRAVLKAIEARLI